MADATAQQAMTPEALAQALGWSVPLEEGDAALLRYLLDDDFERAGADERAALKKRLGGRPANLASCKWCENLCLERFVPRDGRCRVCSHHLSGVDGGVSSAMGLVERPDTSSGPLKVTIPDDGQPPSRWGLAQGAIKLGAGFELGTDNLDWEARAELIEAERAREADEARRKVEEEARRKVEEAARLEAEAERERLEEEERLRKAEEERLRKEEEERLRKEEEERLRKEEEERLRLEEEERLRLEEEARRKVAERKRPALGCIYGEHAGQILRIDDLPDGELQLDEPALFVADPAGEMAVHLIVPAGSKASVNDRPVGGDSTLKLGDVVTIGDEAYAIEETGELDAVSAPAIHFKRTDDKPGGPWAYWNDEVWVGALMDCAVTLHDEGVDDHHAKVVTRYGQVVLEDVSTHSDGVWISGEARKWAILRPDVVFSLGSKGPNLQIAKGEAKLRPKEKAARAMKPSRHNRTVLEVLDENEEITRQVFLFTRREVRFGSSSTDAEGKVKNELVLRTTLTEPNPISDEQGGLLLAREVIEIQRWRTGESAMSMDEDEIPAGERVPLRRSFDLRIGDHKLEGRAYRSPSDVEAPAGPPQLGMSGGHPYECVRLDRDGTMHSYVFLVRMLRIGSEPGAPLRVNVPGVAENHVRIIFGGGKFSVVAPRADQKVIIEPPGADEVECEPGVPMPLSINAQIKIGQATLIFRVLQDSDFNL
jgi:hypothetical protein